MFKIGDVVVRKPEHRYSSWKLGGEPLVISWECRYDPEPGEEIDQDISFYDRPVMWNAKNFDYYISPTFNMEDWL